MVAPILVSRLAHQLYWWDPAFHGDLRRQAEAELAAVDDKGLVRDFSGDSTETEWRRFDDSIDTARVSFEQGVQIRRLDVAEWQALLAELHTRWQTLPATAGDARDAKSLPLGVLSPLTEEKEYFWASQLRSAGDDFVRVANYTWWKTSFSEWWEEARQSFPAEIDELAARAELQPTGRRERRAARRLGEGHGHPRRRRRRLVLHQLR